MKRAPKLFMSICSRLATAFFFAVLFGAIVSPNHSPALSPHEANASTETYTPRGVGGGGALASFAISPYAKLRLVGTDMGILFRSLDDGKSWAPIDQKQIQFGSDLTLSSEIGFSSDGKTVFFADQGANPKKSSNSGASWTPMNLPIPDHTRILYFKGSASNPKLIFCGTTDGLYLSRNLGDSWSVVAKTDGRSTGTSELSIQNHPVIFHGTDHAILISKDDGKTFQSWFQALGTSIRGFTGGSDAKGTTLAFMDANGDEACAWAKHASDSSAEQKANTLKECGWLWSENFSTLPETGNFQKQKKEAGRFIRMAENDSRTLYVTGGDWVRQYGSKVWVSKDAGAHFSLVMQIYDWDEHPYAPWSPEHLEYSAVGLDVGWDDNAPTSFAINEKNSAEVGSTGYYFLHTSNDYGDHWLAPFTRFADTGAKTKGKRWKSTGLEVSSVLKLKFHPKNPKLAYASVADQGGWISEDGGNSFRISKVKYNTNYDYAFDPEKADFAFAASGSRHDFPLNTNAPLHEEGGIFETENRGKTWTRLTPESNEFDRQFLSVAYDPIHQIVYGGTEGGGIARSRDRGKHWDWINAGLPTTDKVIPQIEIDPKDGTPYALLTGNAPEFANANETGIYRLENLSAGNSHWVLLRKNVQRPKDVEQKSNLWQFPSSFAIDFSNPKRAVLWLSDIENKGAWLATGAWKSTDGGDHWLRMVQSTHATSVTLNPKNSNQVMVAGLYDESGKWGKGGALISNDAGATFKKNAELPLQSNLFNITPDPNQNGQGFFLYFGGGIYHGPIR